MKKFAFIVVFLIFAVLDLSGTPFFQASKTQPYHLSIGAVLFNQEGCIACHHFKEIFGFKDIYILMRESMEDDETPLMTLHRGLKEEFGATAYPIAFLGCLSGCVKGCRISFGLSAIETNLIWSLAFFVAVLTFFFVGCFSDFFIGMLLVLCWYDRYLKCL